MNRVKALVIFLFVTTTISLAVPSPVTAENLRAPRRLARPRSLVHRVRGLMRDPRVIRRLFEAPDPVERLVYTFFVLNILDHQALIDDDISPEE